MTMPLEAPASCRSSSKRAEVGSQCVCGRKWAGLAECHCSTCHLHFKSITGFDAHRTGDHAIDVGRNRRRCMTPAELLRPRKKSGKPTLVPTPDGKYWVTELKG